MYNSWSESMHSPIDHHKTRAGGHDVDYLQPPLPVTAGTSCIDSPSKMGYREFQNPSKESHRQFCNLIAVESEGGHGFRRP